MHKKKHIFKFTFTAMALASLVACSSSKKVVTVDDSADYQGATSLQPLKRPATKKVVADPVVTATPIVETAPINQQTIVETVEVPELDEALIIDDTVENVAEESAVAVESPDTLENEIQETAAESEFEIIQTDVPYGEVTVASTVIVTGKGAARMEVNAEFDQAWAYLNDNLKTSDLTVFSRNKVARRFSIGCGGIEAAPAAVKKSGWSFLNREKHERLEYCVLELNQKRDQTHVSVLNRSGVEVLGAFSKPIFERILAK